MKTNRLFYKFMLWVLLIAAFSVQALSVYFLSLQNTEYALAFHLISACLFPYSLWKLMPKKFENEQSVMILLWLICALVPFISGIGLLLCFTLSAYFSKTVEVDVTENVSMETLPDDILENLQLAQYNGSSLQAILDMSDSEDSRMQAVLKTRQMSDQEAIPILKRALLDPVDEVRLLAYSMLDKKEKFIDTMIRSYLQNLGEKSSKKDSILHFKLAECYWELSYLGLVQGKAQTHVLGNAYKHIQATLKDTVDNAEAYFLQARIALVLDLFEVAEISLSHALTAGMSKTRIAPYQAELAFMTRNFDQISQHVNAVDDNTKKNAVVAEILAQWA
ncbi:MAG: hypothetical protein KAG06_05320 [Methylococcales bacterium]|nr:hypothetical protein [Methylococcales bacterium]